MKSFFVAIVSTALVALPGCADYSRPAVASSSYAPTYSTPSIPSHALNGVVTAVRVMDEPTAPRGAGMLLGGVAGGLLGHQIGHGRGNTAATIGGAAAGALLGNEIERSQQASAVRRSYQVDVRFTDGSYQTLQSDSPFRVGQRVQVRDGVLMPR